MKRMLTTALLCQCSVLCLNACVQTTPQWDSRFGDSVRMAVAQQTLNPDAAQKHMPEAIDGNASREAVGRYRTSFKETQPNTSAFTIGVGR